MKNKKIKVKTRLKNKQKIIEITDHGIGIPEEDQDFILIAFIEWINLVQEVKAVMDSDYLLRKNHSIKRWID